MRKIQKRPIDKRFRIGVLVILIAILCLSSYSLYQAYQLPFIVDKDVSACNYEQRSNFNYVVLLKPNNLYDTSTLGSNMTYFTKIVDRIDTIFSYEFTCDNPASIQGNYEVIATVSTELWEKNFVIVPGKEFSGEKKANFTAKFPLNLTVHNDFVESIGKEIGVQAKEPKLKLIYNINTVATIKNRQVKETFAPTMVIPLSKGAFDISGDISSRKPGSITRTEPFFRQDVIDKRIYTFITTILFFILLLLFAYLTKNKPIEMNRVEETVANINKKYGDWIADAKEMPLTGNQVSVSLNSMEDLIKIAEELGRPVIHVKNAQKHYYYVLDGSMRYEHLVDLYR
ncbi:MAG: hypothetical protein FP814_15765 [Desulfobacterium sp.]|nr:hypothetical protein [Desulfobacterium sp.]MBU3967167.1 DUF5305 domain-containing protein [Euryarchaeota archaeon]MBU4037455.1 DUF5305 domain-containing protein [Pseudomonadota bacterium]